MLFSVKDRMTDLCKKFFPGELELLQGSLTRSLPPSFGSRDVEDGEEEEEEPEED